MDTIENVYKPKAYSNNYFRQTLATSAGHENYF